MIMRMVVLTVSRLTAMAAIRFLAAGGWSWPQGWVFLTRAHAGRSENTFVTTV